MKQMIHKFSASLVLVLTLMGSATQCMEKLLDTIDTTTATSTTTTTTTTYDMVSELKMLPNDLLSTHLCPWHAKYQARLP